MLRLKTLKQLFQRNRRPGNFFFASLFLAFSLFLLFQINIQTEWRTGTKFSAQPALWPIISLSGMTFFAILNWISAAWSPKIPGRWQEIVYWIKSFEYVAWFMAYVIIVPIIGYLFSSIIFALTLAYRAGYRSPKILLASILTAIATVLLFKTFLQVKVPGGLVYEYLPDSIRSLMLTFF